MNPLTIHLFGGVDLARGDQRLPPFATQKARSLFAYLALNRTRLHSRDALVGLFWGDRPEAVARKCLRTDIWRVRSVVTGDGEETDSVLLLQDHKIGFNRDVAHWIDVAEFESRIARVRTADPQQMTPDEVDCLESAVALYRGDLPEGLYDDWFLYERERMRLLYLGTLERLMRFRQSQEDWAAAAALGQRLLAADPLREHVHRELIRCYYRQGNRPAALRQYTQCEAVLRSELDIEPMAETRQLWDEVRGETVAVPISSATRSREEPSWKAALDAAFLSLDSVTRELEQLRALLEGPEIRGRRVV